MVANKVAVCWLIVIAGAMESVEVLLQDTCVAQTEALSALQTQAVRQELGSAFSKYNPVRAMASGNVLLETGSDAGSRFCTTVTGALCLSNLDCGMHQTCFYNTCRCLPRYCARRENLGPGVRCAEQDMEPANGSDCIRTTTAVCGLDAIGTPCRRGRGAALCVHGRCTCAEGLCADDSGICRRRRGPLVSRVVPVSKKSPSFPGAHGNVKTAICFSGGGSRAMTVALGVLRALHHLDLVSKLDAVSSISGGTWAAAVWMFAKEVVEDGVRMPADAGTVLGARTEPKLLTLRRLAERPPVGFHAAFTPMSAVWKGPFAGTTPTHYWEEIYAKLVLSPFGLGSTKVALAASEEDVARIRRANPNLAQQEFLTPRSDRPKSFVMGGTVMAPAMYLTDESNYVLLQMSPDYSGTPFGPGRPLRYEPAVLGLEPLEDVRIGGGLIETFAFGSDAPLQAEDQAGGEAVLLGSPPATLSLAKAVSVSSDALPVALIGVDGVPAWLQTPAAQLAQKETLWPIGRFGSSERHGLRHAIADGGLAENSGVLPMIQRGAQFIISVHASSPFPENSPLGARIDFCRRDLLSLDLDRSVTGGLLGLFWTKPVPRSRDSSTNKVFRTEELLPLLCSFQRDVEGGRPAIQLRRLEVLRNDWWGIEGSSPDKPYFVEMLFVLNLQHRNFEDQLPDEVQEELQFSRLPALRKLLRAAGRPLRKLGKLITRSSRREPRGLFEFFPSYQIVFQPGGELQAYSYAQVNLLAAHAEHMVYGKAQLFQDFLSGRSFRGS